MATPRILVVDDDLAQCNLTAHVLTGQGYEVDIATFGSKALELFGQKVYTVVILDYRMPDMDGLVLFREMKDRQPDVNGVFLTAYASIDMIEAALEAGVRRVVPKQSGIDELKSVMEEIVAEPA